MRLHFLAAALLLCGAATAARAEVVEVVTEASAPATNTWLPSKGMTKAAVVHRYGEPATKHPTVGGASRRQPPITRWDYNDFTVVFEYDHVVDTVQRGHPAPVKVTTGLIRGAP